jgi:penicillin-binding protein 1C
MLPLQTTGGEGRRWWFLNGETDCRRRRARCRWSDPDRYQLVVMDESGSGAANFTLQ